MPANLSEIDNQIPRNQIASNSHSYAWIDARMEQFSL